MGIIHEKELCAPAGYSGGWMVRDEPIKKGLADQQDLVGGGFHTKETGNDITSLLSFLEKAYLMPLKKNPTLSSTVRAEVPKNYVDK